MTGVWFLMIVYYTARPGHNGYQKISEIDLPTVSEPQCLAAGDKIRSAIKEYVVLPGNDDMFVECRQLEGNQLEGRMTAPSP